MQRTTILALFAFMTIWVPGPTTAQDADPVFDGPISTDAVRFVVSTSPDGKASTMLFDNFDVATDVGQATEPDVRMRKFTYVRDIKSTSDSLVVQDFRGYLSRDGLASATMIVHAGGKTTVVDLKQAIEDSSGATANKEYQTRQQAEEAADNQGFTDNDPEGDDDDDFFTRIETPVPEGQSLQTTVILLVDRVQGDDDSSAYLVVDSIDSLVKAQPAKKK